MEEALSMGQIIGDGRYEVIKALNSRADSRTYMARDLDTGEVLFLREFILPSATTPDQRVASAGHLAEVLLVLSRFDHPGLARIGEPLSEGDRLFVFMEWVEGVSLQTLLEMSVRPLPEAQVLPWAMELCDALHYMQDRPKPFLFGGLDPRHIMLGADGNLRLVNFGLGRLLADQEGTEFSERRDLLLKEMRSLGRTLVLLLTRRPPEPDGLFREDGMSRGMVDLIKRLLRPDGEHAFNSFEEVKRALARTRHHPAGPHEAQAGQSSPAGTAAGKGPKPGDGPSSGPRRRLWRVALETSILLVLALLAWSFLPPRVQPRQGPAAYVSCGNEIQAIDLLSGMLLARIPVDHAVTSMVATPDGSRLIAASPASPNLWVLDTRSNRILGLIPVGRGPARLVLEPGGRRLYILHPEDNQVGVIQASSEALHLDPTTGLFQVQEQLSEALAPPSGLAAGAAWPREGDASAPPASPQAIFCSSLPGHRISSVDPTSLDVLAVAAVDSPGALALTPDAQTLLAAQASTGHVLTFQAPTLEPGPRILLVGGSRIQSLLVSPDGQELWALNGSGTLGVIGLYNRRLRGTVEPGGRPTAACWRMTDAGRELWVAVRSPDRIVAVDPATRTVKRTIPIGAPPTDLCCVP